MSVRPLFTVVSVLVLSATACAESSVEEQASTESAIGAPEGTLAGRSLTAAESRWIAWVGTNVLPHLPGSAEARIELAARVTWWSLKEGVLDVSPNPWRHNLCTMSGGDRQIGDLDTCASTWQVGMSGLQMPNVSDGTVIAAAQRAYPGESIASILARIANDAGVPSSTKNAIVASSGRLQASWLARDPAIGFALNAPFVDDCLPSGPSWCYGNWDTAIAFASDPQRVATVIDALETRFRNGGGTSTNTTPSPSPGTTPTSAACGLGDGLYCGGNGGGTDRSMLYRCRGGSAAPVERCEDGCQWNPDGKNDACRTSVACPYGAGMYCGGNGVDGAPDVLFRCTSQRIDAVQKCARGCRAMPNGRNDACE